MSQLVSLQTYLISDLLSTTKDEHKECQIELWPKLEAERIARLEVEVEEEGGRADRGHRPADTALVHLGFGFLTGDPWDESSPVITCNIEKGED